MFKKSFKAILCMVCLSLCLSTVCAEDGFSFSRLTFSADGPFRLDPVKDSIIGTVGLSLNGASFLIERSRKDNALDVWNGVIYDSADVNSVDRFFMQPYSKTLDTLGDGMVLASVLAPAVLMAAPMEDWLTVGVMYAETLLLANGIKELTKKIAGRVRPYMYFDGSKPQKDIDEGDWNDSFPSGHTSMAFTGAAFASYVFGRYFPDSPWRYAVTAASYSLAALTATFRMAGGSHFFTDVLTGALIGTVSGILVPWLHETGTSSESGVKPVVSPVSIGFRLDY